MLKIPFENKLNEILTCKKCKKFYLEPVILPCNKNICKSHIYEESKDNFYYKCDFCEKVHLVPDNGFILNETADDILKLKLHLNEKIKEAHDLIEEFDETLRDMVLLNKDPENFIYEYISLTRNKIDLERERILFKLNSSSDNLLQQLKTFEDECRTNFENIKNELYFDETDYQRLKEKSLNWKDEFRKPQLDDYRAEQLVDEISMLVKQNRHKFIQFKNDILRGKGCYFKSNDIMQNYDNFGHVIFNKYKNAALFDEYHLKSIFYSTILKPEQSIELIDLCQFDWKSKIRLIYRASTDGFEAAHFHNKCNGIPNTLTIVKVKDGPNIFGGFTQAVWDNSNEYKEDKNAFIFSLINKDRKAIKMKFNPKNGTTYSIRCNSTYGPTFGAGFDLFISSHSNCTISSYSNLGHSFNHPTYSYRSEEAENFLAGSFKFSTSEIEVYRID